MWPHGAAQVGWQPSSANRTSFLQRFKSTYVAPYYEVRRLAGAVESCDYPAPVMCFSLMPFITVLCILLAAHTLSGLSPWFTDACPSASLMLHNAAQSCAATPHASRTADANSYSLRMFPSMTPRQAGPDHRVQSLDRTRACPSRTWAQRCSRRSPATSPRSRR